MLAGAHSEASTPCPRCSSLPSSYLGFGELEGQPLTCFFLPRHSLRKGPMAHWLWCKVPATRHHPHQRGYISRDAKNLSPKGCILEIYGVGMEQDLPWERTGSPQCIPNQTWGQMPPQTGRSARRSSDRQVRGDGMEGRG